MEKVEQAQKTASKANPNSEDLKNAPLSCTILSVGSQYANKLLGHVQKHKITISDSDIDHLVVSGDVNRLRSLAGTAKLYEIGALIVPKVVIASLEEWLDKVNSTDQKSIKEKIKKNKKILSIIENNAKISASLNTAQKN